MTSFTLLLISLFGPVGKHCHSFPKMYYQKVENRSWTLELSIFDEKCLPPMNHEKFIFSRNPDGCKIEYSLFQYFVKGRGKGPYLMKRVSRQMSAWKADDLKAYIVAQCTTSRSVRNSQLGTLSSSVTVREVGITSEYQVKDIESMSRVRLRLKSSLPGCSANLP